MIPHRQLSLAEVFEDCQNNFDNDKYQFLNLLDETIDLDEIFPASFVTHFHASTGRPRKHQLYPMLKAFLIQRIFSITTDMLLIVFLKYSQELRNFCGFDVVPDKDKSLADSKALLPVLIDFFQKHPLMNPKTFLGDAAFDTIEIYKSLFGEIGFKKAFVLLVVKLRTKNTSC